MPSFLHRHRRRITFANVTSLLALFVALGGTGYAAVALAPGSVGTAQLQKGAVTSGKILDGTLKAQDFKSNQLLVGPAGPRGAAGSAGPAGPAGVVDTSQFYSKTQSDARYLRGTITVVGTSPVIATTNFGGLTVNCPSGYQAISGGADPSNVFTMYMTASAPYVDATRAFLTADGQHGPATGWQAYMRNDGAAASFKLMVVCSPIG